jgi:twitching motility protein PilT
MAAGYAPQHTGMDDLEDLMPLEGDGFPAYSSHSAQGVMEREDSSADAESLSIEDVHIDDLLRMTVEKGASDLHLSVGLPPMVRVDGRLYPLPFAPLNPRDIQRLVYDILTGDQIQRFEKTKELDFSYGVKDVGRFRFNVYRQRGSVGCAMRAIPSAIPSLEQLRLPPILRELTRRHSGLILVTGPTGSGKSTTIASMIDVINTERNCHIMTIEDPIEYLHSHKNSMVNQRELGTDTDSFHNALRAVVREDPDVILVGEMRDLETIRAALTLAETGHLVFATLHTRNAPQTIDRVVDVFPPEQQEQIRIQLSNTLESVIAQQLLPMLGGGRVAAVEIMIATPAIRNLIREGKVHQIYSIMETSAQQGMQTMDRALADLHLNGLVSFEEAVLRCIDRENFMRFVQSQ